ncbi:hypothetical protein L1987_80438 [Smallanthus sonchifolius]|uniref:Uncharacterized protein n=1 Tax=Smallanthus sonchifolius TaxID=185202 RepID=A0ACB8YN94_9ASTR|nr:hypothetical protein L1987_80438 [Smallanthus sonchifolius]
MIFNLKALAFGLLLLKSDFLYDILSIFSYWKWSQPLPPHQHPHPPSPVTLAIAASVTPLSSFVTTRYLIAGTILHLPPETENLMLLTFLRNLHSSFKFWKPYPSIYVLSLVISNPCM